MKNKPIIVISKCIAHAACRYDGSMIKSRFVSILKDYVQFVTTCPEVEIGLTVPREAIRIISHQGQERLVGSLSGNDTTQKMVDFSDQFINSLSGKTVHGFILKNRSPSCGIKDCKVYKSFGKSQSIPVKTAGFFGRAIIAHYPDLPIEDEGRLTNYNIREHFLTRVYSLFHFGQAVNDMKSLVHFHSNNKYLLMAYHQKLQKLMGQIVANHDRLPTADVIANYHQHLKQALSAPLKRGTNINMLMHLMGYFKRDLSPAEKDYFLNVLNQYKTKKIPFSVPLSILKSWVIRFNEPYLKTQTIFEPFPEGILQVTDSGKGID